MARKRITIPSTKHHTTQDPTILPDVNYQTTCHPRKMATIIIPVHANHQSPHTPRKLATTMILMPLAQDPMILPPDVNYQIARRPRKMATISVGAKRPTPHSLRKLAIIMTTTMIPIPDFTQDPITLLPDVNYKSTRCQRRMATIMIPARVSRPNPHTPRKFAITIPGPNLQTARHPTPNTVNNPRPTPTSLILTSLLYGMDRKVSDSATVW
jgi:hypothetical protein